MKQFLLLSSFLLSFFIVSAEAQNGIVDRDAKQKPSVMFLGSYHFANPQRDVVKTGVTDVSTPERQKQLEELVKKLGKFKPTKVALECAPESAAKYQEKFTKYLEGSYQLQINETEQIGFRMAKNAGLREVYCVDVSDDVFPGKDADYDYQATAAKDAQSDAFLKSRISKLQAEGEKDQALLDKMSISKQFIYLNEPRTSEKFHTFYFDLLRLKNEKGNVGANWLGGYWYNRNLMILANIIKLTQSSDERIFAVYGAGHLKLLNQFAAESGFYNVESPLKYLKK